MPRRATMSFEERREALYKHMAGAAPSEEVISKEIKLAGHAVPKFIENLDKVERESLKSKLVFK